MALLHNEVLLGADGDLNALRWQNPPDMDSLGAPVANTEAFRVSTAEELALVLGHARERRMLVNPIGAATSSKSFGAPPASFMNTFDKAGVVLVGFNPRLSNGETGPFGRIHVDMRREEVTVGAGVTLREMDDAVRQLSIVANGAARARLMNLLRITTMDAFAVATALGTGGVSDGGDCSNTLMTRSLWVDGRGVLHEENYSPRPGDYFASDTSSFARVNHKQVGREMSGRGGPFGIGVEASFRLMEAPVDTHTIVWGFHDGGGKSAREKLEEFIVRMNTWSDQMKAQQAPLQTLSLELMDRKALALAREGMGGWSINLNGGEPEFAIIGDFGHFDFYDEGLASIGASDAMIELYNLGAITEDESELVTAVDGEDACKLRDFRLQGPEHMRSILKKLQREAKDSGGPAPATESTDWAVNPRDPELVHWYLENLFRLHDGIGPHVIRGALYGHLYNRLDLHYRVIIPFSQAAFHTARLARFGMEVGDRQMLGEKVRVRGEKPEQTFGRDLQCIGERRDGDHKESNRRLLRRVDPDGLFKHRAPERWGGQYDWR